jgi:hypothetical protein
LAGLLGSASGRSDNTDSVTEGASASLSSVSALDSFTVLGELSRGSINSQAHDLIRELFGLSPSEKAMAGEGQGTTEVALRFSGVGASDQPGAVHMRKIGSLRDRVKTFLIRF